jgi:REP element-mobilizing transposase RayT
MDDMESLSHTKWECKYHVVFIPKYRRKQLYGELRRYLGEVLRKLAEQKESRIEEGHLLPDHVHMMIAIPPTYAVSQVIGFIKERVRSTGHGCTESEREILWGRISGRVGITCPRWAGMRR